MNLLNECHNSENVSLEASGCTTWHAVGWPTEKYTDNALTNTLITRDHFKFTVQDCCKKSGIISLRISQCCLSMPTGWPGWGGEPKVYSFLGTFSVWSWWRRILISWGRVRQQNWLLSCPIRYHPLYTRWTASYSSNKVFMVFCVGRKVKDEELSLI